MFAAHQPAMTFFIVGETPQGYVNSEQAKSQVILLDENLRRNKQRKDRFDGPQNRWQTLV